MKWNNFSKHIQVTFTFQSPPWSSPRYTCLLLCKSGISSAGSCRELLLPAGRGAWSAGRIPGGSRWWRTARRGWAARSFYKHPWSERGLHPGPPPCCPACSLERNQHPMGREFTRSSCWGARIWLWIDQIKALPVLLSWPARSPLCQ